MNPNDKLIGTKVPLLKAKPSLEDLRAELTNLDLLAASLQVSFSLNSTNPAVRLPKDPQQYVACQYDPVAIGLIENSFANGLRALTTQKLMAWRQVLTSAIETETRKRIATGGVVAPH